MKLGEQEITKTTQSIASQEKPSLCKMSCRGLTEELAFIGFKKLHLECYQLALCWCCTDSWLLVAGAAECFRLLSKVFIIVDN